MVKVLYNGMHFEVATEDEAMELFHQLLSWDRYRYEKGEDIPFEDFLMLQEGAPTNTPAPQEETLPQEEAPKEEPQREVPEVTVSPTEKRRRKSS